MTDTNSTTPGNTGDPFTDPAIALETVTNDAVAGETIIDNGNYAGATGSEPEESEPEESEPIYADNDLDGEDIDLRDEE